MTDFRVTPQADDDECERQDCRKIAATASDVYCAITGGLLSYPTYDARTILTYANDETQKFVDEEVARACQPLQDENDRLRARIAQIAERVDVILQPIDSLRHGLTCPVRTAIYEGWRCECDLSGQMRSAVAGHLRAALAASPVGRSPLQDENERLRAIVEAVRALAEPKLPGNGPIPAAMILRALRGKSVYAEDLHAALTAGQGGEL